MRYDDLMAQQNPVMKAASDAIRTAEQEWKRLIEEQYPRGQRVHVTHWRGEFTGHVIGYCIYGHAIWVENSKSGKSKKWHFAHVKII